MDNREHRAVPAVKTVVFLASLALLLVSCAQPTVRRELSPAPSAGSSPAPLSGSSPATEPVRPYPSIPEGLERIEPTSTSPAVSSAEVPASLLEDILEDLSSRLEIDPQEIVVAKGEAILWPDGSLSCPQPGEFYTQAAVSGYWIILQVGDLAYDYRASETGHFFLCEAPLPH